MNNSFTTSLVFLGVDGNSLFVTAVALDCLGLKGMLITVGRSSFQTISTFFVVLYHVLFLLSAGPLSAFQQLFLIFPFTVSFLSLFPFVIR